MACVGSCAWTRTLRNARNINTTWNVTVNNAPDVNVVVSPSTFSFTAPAGNPDVIFADGMETPPVFNASQELTITATPNMPIGLSFVRIDFVEANGLAPTAHLFVAVQGQP
ncbi:MAG: hypothetical protein COS34_01385 [Lysobacterales bacterium CG02_land_8_20_14_3_00_62_12]|nr:MAG: hypothetical protein COS34_01385 [Xanthomonadales bacterium CG02_land_8_20_14_3_00_62_12]